MKLFSVSLDGLLGKAYIVTTDIAAATQRAVHNFGSAKVLAVVEVPAHSVTVVN